MDAQETTFRGRRAIRLGNDLLDLVMLPGGGHVASLRLHDSPVNPLWEPHWATIEPEQYDAARHPEYGRTEGKLLASIAGHMLCLNHFGELSDAELAADGYEHGEAPNLPWTVDDFGADRQSARLCCGVDLPEAGMHFQRTISMRSGEARVRFEEEVTNLRRSDSPLAYQQHVTIGAPFLEPGVTRLDLPGTQAHTFPRSSGAADPLPPDTSFTWPDAPGAGRLDVFPRALPLEAVCTVALEPQDDLGYVAVSNPRLGLLLAYVFPVETYPWAALWYENQGIADAPYGGRTLAWGLEFGTAALQVGRIEMLAAGPLFGRRRFGVLSARETLRTTYEALLQPIPSDWAGVARIERTDKGLIVVERGAGRQLHVGGAK